MSSRINFSMTLSTGTLHGWIRMCALGVARSTRKLGKFLQRLNVPRSWMILAICQSVILLLLLLTWPKSVTLSLVIPASEVELWRSVIQDFEQQNPDIRIALNAGNYTTDAMEAIYTADSQQASPSHDLLYLDMIWVQQFAASGQLRDLTGLVSESELTEFLPEDVKVGQYQNKLYWLPLRSDVGVLYYRADLLAATGYTAPPQTFQELLDMSRRIQSSGLAEWGYIWQGRQYEGLVAVFEEVLAGYGGFWIQPDTNEVGLDQPAALKSVKFLQRVIQEGISPIAVRSYNEDDSFNKFAEGETVFLRNWPFIQPRLNQSQPLRNRVQIAPTVHAPGRVSTPCKGGWGFGISSRATHAEEAWRAIQFFTSEAAQRQLTLESGYLPSRRSLFTDRNLLEQFPYLNDLYGAVENSVPRPLIPQYREASEILQRRLSDALNVPLNDSTADADQRVADLMKTAAQETRDLLAQSTNAGVQGEFRGGDRDSGTIGRLGN